ncbi:MAG: Na/Pi symporter [Candidatus Eisenbacteria bacterium]
MHQASRTAVPACAPQVHPGARAERWADALRGLGFLAAFYAFLLSIELMSVAFNLLGGAFATQLIRQTAAPLSGLMIGLLTTSIVQSSSLTTSLLVSLVCTGLLPLRLAIPIVMGANIGTTVTNTIVSLGHVSRRAEFQRAFAAATVHDIFNILTVAVLFPLECLFHPIEHAAIWLAQAFAGVGGLQLVSPLKSILSPVAGIIAGGLPYALPLLLLALVMLFVALNAMVKIMRSLVMSRVERLFERVLFRNDLAGFTFGWLLTSVVQSSSVTTSLVVPLAGTGILSVRRIFPYTLGANIGTTITAILASFALGKPAGIMVAAAHLVFNVAGMLIFYPARSIPIGLACRLGHAAGRSRRHTILVLATYVGFYSLPLLYILLH